MLNKDEMDSFWFMWLSCQLLYLTSLLELAHLLHILQYIYLETLPFELQLLSSTSVMWFTLQMAALTAPRLGKNPFLLTCYVYIQSLWKIKRKSSLSLQIILAKYKKWLLVAILFLCCSGDIVNFWRSLGSCPAAHSKFVRLFGTWSDLNV